ncbi:MAG: aminotransferase class I/II-fold pyridoxal phosphate-dependent enzyme, partial [Chloroflexota bacterium]
MSSSPVSSRITSMGATMAPIITFMQEAKWAQHNTEPDISDFTFGNPHDNPLDSYVTAVQKTLTPQNKDWFAYKQSVPEAQAVIAETISDYLGHTFYEQDICITNGAFAGLNVVIKTIVDVGDEIIFISPHWFAYEGMIISAGGKAVNISIDPDTFNLDLEAIKNAISPRTRGIIINTPHNPTGKIYDRETLTQLATILEEASQKNGRTVYLISDEAYHQIIFEGNQFVSPATIYPNSFLVYT